ncbi:MAG: hypothetical protein OXL96_22255 [Candidatus Poribacteria bacterium]|nr:hypothetical protein [Candidatus Poribacteria bacterium]
MNADNRKEPVFDTDFMIDNAAGLQSVAVMVDREGRSALDGCGRIDFIGSFQAAPVLWALGIEIALKAWVCQSSKGSRPKGHDLLELFDELDEKTQHLLEEAWKCGRGKGTADDPIPELAMPKRVLEAKTFQELIDFRLSSLRELLEEHRKVFVNWRYLHERPRERPHSNVLDKVLTVLIDTYRKHREGWAN